MHTNSAKALSFHCYLRYDIATRGITALINIVIQATAAFHFPPRMRKETW